MTFANVIATGSGKLAFRFVIEGLPTQFVTDKAMELTMGDGRVRRTGLRRTGIVIDEAVDIPDAKLNVAGMSIAIVDVAGEATNVFSRIPGETSRAWLRSNLTASGTTATISNNANFAANDIIHINTECIRVGGKSSTTSLTSLSRGIWDTKAQAHYFLDDTGVGESLIYPEIVKSYPPVIEGRRCWIYAYGDGDSPSGDGTLIFRGVCLSDAEQSDAVTWRIQIESVVRLLDQDFGSDSSVRIVGARGIYYPHNRPFAMDLVRYAGNSASGSSPDILRIGPITGFFETQSDFVSALNTELASKVSGAAWDETFIAVVDDLSGTWELEYITDATTERFVASSMKNVVDGNEALSFVLYDASGDTIVNVATASRYRIPYTETIRGARTVPRGSIGYLADQSNSSVTRDDTADDSGNVENRLFLESTSVLGASVTQARITWPSQRQGSLPADSPGSDYSTTVSIDAVDSDWNFIEFDPPVSAFFTRDDAISAFLTQTITEVGSVSTFAFDLTSRSVDEVNRGSMPFMTTDEIDVVSWIRAINDSVNIGPATNRTYGVTKRVKLYDLLSEEWKFAGVFPVITDEGKIGLKAIKANSDSFVSQALSIGDSKIAVREGMPRMRRNGLGSVTTVEIGVDYSFEEDKHNASVQVVSVSSRGRKRIPAAIKIEPKSTQYVGGGSVRLPDLDPSDYARIAGPVLDLFGVPYSVIEIPVTLAAWNILLGDTIAITTDLLPNPDGGRGVSQRGARVVRRRFDLDRGVGMIEAMFVDAFSFGYPPAFGVVGATNVSGNQWSLTLVNTDPFGIVTWADGDAEDWFAVNDRVRRFTFGASASLSTTGTVTSVSGNTLVVTFDSTASTWTSGGIYNYGITFALGTDASLTERQRRFAYVAGSDQRIDFASGTVDARRFVA